MRQTNSFEVHTIFLNPPINRDLFRNGIRILWLNLLCILISFTSLSQNDSLSGVDITSDGRCFLAWDTDRSDNAQLVSQIGIEYKRTKQKGYGLEFYYNDLKYSLLYCKDSSGLYGVTMRPIQDIESPEQAEIVYRKRYDYYISIYGEPTNTEFGTWEQGKSYNANWNLNGKRIELILTEYDDGLVFIMFQEFKSSSN